jgi:hypothetical protein
LKKRLHLDYLKRSLTVVATLAARDSAVKDKEPASA